jgi:hypothetical protein
MANAPSHSACRSNALRSKLHRNFGKMYARQGKHVEALRSLSLDAYYSSLAVGPEDIATATAYYLLGEVFAAKVSDSDAVDRVCDSMTVSRCRLRRTPLVLVDGAHDAACVASVSAALMCFCVCRAACGLACTGSGHRATSRAVCAYTTRWLTSGTSSCSRLAAAALCMSRRRRWQRCAAPLLPSRRYCSCCRACSSCRRRCRFPIHWGVLGVFITTQHYNTAPSPLPLLLSYHALVRASQALNMLDGVCRRRETHLGGTHIATGEAFFTLVCIAGCTTARDGSFACHQRVRAMDLFLTAVDGV